MTITEFHRAVIGIGSNTADSKVNVEAAIAWCAGYFSAVDYSSVYSTRPYGAKACAVGYDYTNAVVIAITDMEAADVNDALKHYETEHGRDSGSRASGIVTIDLDLVIYDDKVLRPQEINREYFAKGYNELASESHGE